jgi:hypothetical protein
MKLNLNQTWTTTKHEILNVLLIQVTGNVRNVESIQ